QEVLLGALVESFAGWTGRRSLGVEVEGHGREEVGEGIDLSRTVGWLTSLYPVFLAAEEAADAASTLGRVKESLRQVPHRGLGYGVLRYLGAPEVRESLSRPASPAVSFNYLGQLDGVLSGSRLLRPAAERPSDLHAPAQRRSHQLELQGVVLDGRLELSCTY